MYLCMAGKIVKNVESEVKKLISNRDLVLEKLEEPTRLQTVNYAVFSWLNDANELIRDEKRLAQEESCLRIPIYYCFPCVFLPSYHRDVCKNFYKVLNRIKKLNAKCEFDLFFNSIPGTTSPNFVHFDSQKLAFNQIFEALQDNSVSLIGLHGKPGSGKTQLAKAVAEKAKYLDIFDSVRFETMSQSQICRMIQSKIHNMDCGQSQIHNMECRTLVILDDVCTNIDLDSRCCAGTRCRSKLVLITRSQQECTLMNCQKEIPLHPLSKDEAWVLFKIHSGINENCSSDLLNVAQELAFHCERSPGAIKKVVSSLKSEPIEEWKALLHAFGHPMARYQIFLSFRGEDTRYSFTGFLYRALCHGGFKTFMDDGKDGLHGGDLISPSLTEAIEASRLSIVVLSENFAHSSWCLDELVKILECMKMKNQLVFPIFYKVEPSDVRYQNNSYGNAMAKHENRLGTHSKEVQNWKSALFEVSNLPGRVYRTGCEYEFIQEIVEYVNSIKRALYLRSMDMVL